MNQANSTHVIIDLDDSKEKAQLVYEALHRTRFESLCNIVFFLTQFTRSPQTYSLNGDGISGYEIKGRNPAALIASLISRFISLFTGNPPRENWNYRLRFPVGGRVEVEIQETLCKSRACNRNYTNATLEAEGIDHFDLVML